jgi:phage antirepressor YoqD-like protein
MQLVNYKQDGIELLINQETGESFASISAISRMIDTRESTIRDYVNKQIEQSRWEALLKARPESQQGGKQSRLLNEDQILEVIITYKPGLMTKFAKVGVRVFLHQLAGFKVQSEAVAPINLTRMQLIELAMESEKELIALKGQVEEDLPFTNFGKIVNNADGKLTIACFLNGCNYGRNRGFELLRKLKIVQKNNALPYQIYVNQGYFEVAIKVIESGGTIKQFPVGLITPKGEIWLGNKLKENESLEKVEAQIERQLTLF